MDYVWIIKMAMIILLSFWSGVEFHKETTFSRSCGLVALILAIGMAYALAIGL